MLDKWFIADIEKGLKTKKRLVIIDESGKSSFLKKYLAPQYLWFETQNELEELEVKYRIEKNHREDRTIIYTETPKRDLKFIREYCETESVLEIRFFHNYIKEKIYQHLQLNIQLPNEELIVAAKTSIGKDETYWMKISKGLGDVFDLEKDLLPFLHAPQQFVQGRDADVIGIFYKKVHSLIGQDFINKPAETLAKEVVKKMLDGLVTNSPDKLLLQVYSQWLDSRTYESSFHTYLKKYKLVIPPNPWTVHPDHPFQKIDEACLKDLSKNLGNKTYLHTHLAKIKQRASNRYAQHLGIDFWQAVKDLVEFDAQEMSALSSLSAVSDFYTHHYYKVEKAIRQLYTAYLQDPSIIRPLQEYYQNLNSVLLDKWFQYIDQYQQNQTGLIHRLLQAENGKVAIIVGDGVSYEIAKSVADKLSTDYKIISDTIMVDYPSETENNMSQLYVRSGEVFAVHKKREAVLKSEFGERIEFVHLDSINETSHTAPYLICTYKDIDEIGEKMQQRALKFISTIEDTMVQKIQILTQNGYKKVFLVSDHGFVLTGLLTEADKIEVNFKGDIKKSERYVRTVMPQDAGSSFEEKQKSYKGFNYLYFSKTIKPFKTPGVYGYSHGGLTPQELIVPCFCFESNQTQVGQLSIQITNKADLKRVTGELFVLKLSAAMGNSNLLDTQRKVYLLFFAKGKEVNKSAVFSLSNGENVRQEYTFDGHQELEVKLLDAISKEQIDTVLIKKDNARDLGGLF